MSWKNLDDITAQLERAGLVLDKSLRTDASIQRWKVQDEDHERRGWSRIKEWKSKRGEYYLVGCYGVWHGNDDGRIDLALNFERSDDDVAAIRATQKAAAAELAKTRKAEARTAGEWAAAVWHHCAAATEHGYLTAKGIGANGARILGTLVATQQGGTHGTIEGLALDHVDQSNLWRLKSAAGALVVPMHDAKGAIAGLQFIYPRGHARAAKLGKEFWPSGMAMGGTFGLMGPIYRDGLLLIAEGFATAATLHEATGNSVAYAFSANNLVKAGEQIRKAYPRMRVLFCADDDYLTEGNPGITAATHAASAIERAAWTAPDFFTAEGKDLREGKKLTDFNDLAVLASPLTVSAQITAKLDALRWHEKSPDPSPVWPPKAGGGGSVNGDRQRLKALITIDEAADRFALIFGGKSTLFDFEEHALIPKADVLDILPDRAWSDLKKHPRWRAFRLDEVGFDPACTDSEIACNLYGGWPTTPAAGECGALLRLLAYLTSGEQNARQCYEWAMKWLAYPIQHPGAKMRTALIFHGPQGTGKNLFFEAVMAIYGKYGRIVDQVAIESPFNEWASGRLFLIADEVVARAELFHVKNKLKHFVTGEWIRINPKNVTAHDEKNHVNIVYLSNELQPLVLEKDDRRHFVIYTPPADEAALYQSVRDELNAGGIAALHDYLLKIDLGDFSEHTPPPMTAAKRDLIDISAASVERFIDDWRTGDAGLPFCPCASSDLYAAYLKWCRQQGISKPRELNQFVGTIGKLPGWERGHKDRYATMHYSGKTKRQRFVIPGVDAMAAAAKAKGEGEQNYLQPPEQRQSQWLTDCYFAFHNALGAEEGPQ